MSLQQGKVIPFPALPKLELHSPTVFQLTLRLPIPQRRSFFTSLSLDTWPASVAEW